MPLPGVSSKSIAVQHTVVALHAQGNSKRKIARDLGMSVNTVLKILSVKMPETVLQQTDTISRIVPKALQAVEKAIDTGDANLAMRYLERTALGDRAERVTFTGDVTLNTAIGMLSPARTTSGSGAVAVPAVADTLALPARTAVPSLPSTTSTTDSPSTPGTPASSSGTEEAEKAGGDDISLTSHKNFAGFLEKFVLHLCNVTLPSLQATPAGGPVLSKSELLHTLREAAVRCLEQGSSREDAGCVYEMAESQSREGGDALQTTKHTEVRDNGGTVR